MAEAFICDAVRTPIGRYAGVLSPVRADDLGAVPIAALLERQANLDTAAVDDVVYGCANQAGEDNRNVARMAALLAGLPPTVPAATVNRLCGSGMNAIGNVADAIQAGGIELAIAGGVESMSRAPFVMAKQTSAFGRNAEIYDTTLGWRFVNRKLEEQYGIDSMATASTRWRRPRKMWPRISVFPERTRMRSPCAASSGRKRLSNPVCLPKKSCPSACRSDAAMPSSSTRTNIRGRGQRSRGSRS
jgi:acetyl-CoA acetyltransferase